MLVISSLAFFPAYMASGKSLSPRTPTASVQATWYRVLLNRLEEST